MAQDPFRPSDDHARNLAFELLMSAEHASLGVLLEGDPVVTRIALAIAEDGAPITLISDLSPHTKALRETPKASLLVGEPGPKGDPLTHPRLTIQVSAHFMEKTEAAVQHYLQQRPKSKLYIGFSDFHLVRFSIQSAQLNGGFGKAYRITAEDLQITKGPGIT